MSDLIRCRDCRHFKLNVWADVGGISLIVAHEMCERWGGGCKTSPDGFCFMAERKEETDEQGYEEKDRMAAL